MRESSVVLCFQVQSILWDSAPTLLCKNCTCWRAPTLGSLVPGSVQRPAKECLCLRSFNFKKANGRIMEERKTETRCAVPLFTLGSWFSLVASLKHHHYWQRNKVESSFRKGGMLGISLVLTASGRYTKNLN